jgi:hypothetical protein
MCPGHETNHERPYHERPYETLVVNTVESDTCPSKPWETGICYHVLTSTSAGQRRHCRLQSSLRSVTRIVIAESAERPLSKDD